MLPFLKNIKTAGIAGTIIKNRAPDEAKEQSEDSSISSHVKSLISAIKSDNHEEAEDCLREIFKALDKEPHSEGPHPEKHSYADQNQEAAD